MTKRLSKIAGSWQTDGARAHATGRAEARRKVEIDYL